MLGYEDLAVYSGFSEQVKKTKRRLLTFLIDAKRAGKQVVGYGAPGKGNTLLNLCGVRTDFLDYTVDRSPHKQGRFLRNAYPDPRAGAHRRDKAGLRAHTPPGTLKTRLHSRCRISARGVVVLLSRFRR
ncbi:MAG: methyltransferase C-terminal domain-containing protein [Burkholderiales bacterium]